MERTLLAQASADLAKRLAASSALPVLGKDLLPLITGVVVVVDLAMRHWVFLRICVERRYLGHRGSPLVTHIPILVLRLGPPVKPVASAGWPTCHDHREVDDGALLANLKVTVCSRDLALSSLLKSLDPKARDKLRRLLVRDLIDFLVLHKEERRKALQLLGEIEAAKRR